MRRKRNSQRPKRKKSKRLSLRRKLPRKNLQLLAKHQLIREQSQRERRNLLLNKILLRR
jgi:hypothetical protein